MSLYIVKAWVDNGPSEYFLVGASGPDDALAFLPLFSGNPDLSVELVPLEAAYRGFAMLTDTGSSEVLWRNT